MRNRVLVVAAAGLALVALAGVAGYVYYFSGLRTSPSQLGLSATPTATSTPATTSVTGTWTVASGSVAGYRVKELFVGQASKHDAVARTSTVSGGLTLSGDASGLQVSAVTFTADLSDLHSVDSVAGRDVTQRDGVVRRQLDVQQFPTATLTIASASVAGVQANQQFDVMVPAKLTIHGVTKDVTVKGKAQLTGDRIEIAGSTSIVMTDFGVQPPQVPFVTVDSAVVIEFDIFLTKAA